MTNIRKLWILAALAVLSACDPYKEENKGPLEILSAFAVAGNSDDLATGLFEASGTTSPFTIPEVDTGTTVFFVKTNKLLDGAAIQADPLSCVPAAAVNLTVNGVVNPPGWFTCYVPATSTPAEGASMVIYQGQDITNTTGYFDSADLEHGFFDITRDDHRQAGEQADGRHQLGGADPRAGGRGRDPDRRGRDVDGGRDRRDGLHRRARPERRQRRRRRRAGHLRAHRDRPRAHRGELHRHRDFDPAPGPY